MAGAASAVRHPVLAAHAGQHRRLAPGVLLVQRSQLSEPLRIVDGVDLADLLLDDVHVEVLERHHGALAILRRRGSVRRHAAGVAGAGASCYVTSIALGAVEMKMQIQASPDENRSIIQIHP